MTTIQVKTETRDLLKRIGDKGKTYDEIIEDLIETYDAHMQMMLDRLAECTPETTRPVKEVLDELDAKLKSRRK